MNILTEKYEQAISKTVDINEHMPTLRSYAADCDGILELGVRGCISSWAFLTGLLEGPGPNRRLFMNDVEECNIADLVNTVTTLNLPCHISFEWTSDLNLRFPEGTRFDMVFIDTWHVYGQLKRELERFHSIANKYIVLHDTEVDGEFGESVRMRHNIDALSKQSGFPVEEITRGLKPAVNEFLTQHREWTMHAHYRNNNGLTILRRVQ